MNLENKTENLSQKQTMKHFRVLKRSLAKKKLNNFIPLIIVAIIKTYRYLISPFLPATCRFHPSCSKYALEAYENFGFWRGSYVSAKRILKCNPFHSGGFDPVDGECPKISLNSSGIKEKNNFS